MNTDGSGFTIAKNATKLNPFEIIPLQTTRKENNWKTEETLARAAVTLEMERIKGSYRWCLWWWWWWLPPQIVILWDNMVDSSWNVITHGDAREGKWRGNWRMEWVDSTLHTTSEHGVSTITTADAHTSAASSRLNWSLRRFKWTRPFPRKTKSGFCVCAITFQLASRTR